MPRYQNDPRFITARFNSTCPETGKEIRKGDECAYYPCCRTAYHLDSEAAQEVRALQFSAACGMLDADW